VEYCESLDVSLAHEARRAGAFWEFQRHLPYALPAYLDADLPPLDRRNPLKADRRAIYRGGRHASDIPRLTSDASEIRQQSPPVGRVR